MIDFKMTKEGLILLVRDYESLEEVLEQLGVRISQMSGFFAKGDKIMLMIENSEKHAPDMPKIVAAIRNSGLEISQILVGSAVGENVNVSGRMKMVEEGDTKSGTKVVKKNLRSGQALVHPGDVIVVGNVHAGAEIMAGGSIAVFGHVKGILRAGLNEGEQAIIAVLSMQPTLIQIAGHILREVGSYDEPVVAYVKDNRVVIDKVKDVKFG
ncbi:septum site-determining protein MinC [Pseudothermotoga thermarum]|uniref:septum site-determining protein MinC n=1 Tax=Pseudothermotoga thermarum TaxID=119394 RepID=UPI00059C91D6|nr:septum site-determining protein MinC [Pseudothermotoga thermarum]